MMIRFQRKKNCPYDTRSLRQKKNSRHLKHRIFYKKSKP